MTVTQATIPPAVDSDLRACLLIIMGLGTDLQLLLSLPSGSVAEARLHLTNPEPADEALPPWLWIKFYWHEATDSTKLSSQHGGEAC